MENDFLTKVFGCQVRQPSPLTFINLILGMNPQSEISLVEKIAQVISFLFYLDSHTGNMSASVIAVSSIKLACEILNGNYLASREDIKIALTSVDTRLVATPIFNLNVENAVSRMRELLKFVHTIGKRKEVKESENRLANKVKLSCQTLVALLKCKQVT